MRIKRTKKKKTNSCQLLCSRIAAMFPCFWWFGRHWHPPPPPHDSSRSLFLETSQSPHLFQTPLFFCYRSHTCQPRSASQSPAHWHGPNDPQRGGNNYEEDHIWLLIWKKHVVSVFLLFLHKTTPFWCNKNKNPHIRLQVLATSLKIKKWMRVGRLAIVFKHTVWVLN